MRYVEILLRDRERGGGANPVFVSGILWESVSVPLPVEESIRYDFGAIANYERSPEGFLTVKGIATRTGVFKYLNPDGSARYELRHPDDVLNPKSLKSLGGKPVTVEHPPKLIGPGNGSEEYGVGSVGNRIKTYDNGLVEVVLNAHHKDAIEEVTSGRKTQLSPGYRTKVIREDGVYEGQEYTHRQTNIEYNHLAIVEKARAGAIASLHMDSSDWEGVDIAVMDGDCVGECECKGSSVNNSTSVGEQNRMAQLTIGKASYEVPENVATAIQPQLERLDSQGQELAQARTEIEKLKEAVARLDSEKTTLVAERDKATGLSTYWENKAQELEFDLEEAEKAREDSAEEEAAKGPTEEEIQARVVEEAQKRVDALDDARTLLSSLAAGGATIPEIKLDASMTPSEVKAAVVAGMNPGEAIAADEIPGFYRALKSSRADSANRADSVATHRADAMEAAVKGAKGFGASARKADGDQQKHATRADAYKRPLAMSRSSVMK